MPLVTFDTPWKHQKTKGSDVFRGYGKRPVAWNGLRIFIELTMTVNYYESNDKKSLILKSDSHLPKKIFLSISLEVL